MRLIKFGIIGFVAILVMSCNTTETTNVVADGNTTELEVEGATEASEGMVGNNNIAYINVDSMLLNYNYYKELEKKLMNKYNRAEDEFNKKRSDLEKEVVDFKRKEASNGFLSQESYQMQGQQLMLKEQELQELNMKLSQNIEKHKVELDKQIQDTIYNFIDTWNKDAGYDFILTKGAIIYAKKGADITPQILDLLNERYDSQKAKK